jgi:hypothetical protein
MRTRVADAVGSSPVPPSLMGRGSHSRSRSRTRALEVRETDDGLEMAERPRGRGLQPQPLPDRHVARAVHDVQEETTGSEQSQETVESKSRLA